MSFTARTESARRPRPPLTAKRLFVALAVGGAALGACIAAGVLVGPAGFGWSGFSGLSRDTVRLLLFDVRLPRVLAAALVGAALAEAGVGFQALLRNPLADPYVLGVSGGASLGGAFALVAGAPPAMVPAAAFVGALATLVALERLSRVGGRTHLFTLLLTGAIFNATSAALLIFLQAFAAGEHFQALVFYLMGRVAPLGASELAVGALAIVAVALLFGLRGRELNALALGEEGAMLVGVDVERLKRTVLVTASLLTGLAVSRAGLIGFVGLVIPHLLRLLVGPDNRLLAPLAALAGGAALVLADLLARTALSPRELPVGAVTALLGGPFFIFLLRRRGHDD